MKFFQLWFTTPQHKPDTSAEELASLQQQVADLTKENADLRLLAESQSQMIDILTQHSENLQAENIEYQEELLQKQQDIDLFISASPGFRQN
jgi:hypothetical protein